MPGTPSSLMSTFDGYPMAQRGEAVQALGFGVGGSLIGGLIAGIVLATLSPPLSIRALGFGPVGDRDRRAGEPVPAPLLCA